MSARLLLTLIALGLAGCAGAGSSVTAPPAAPAAAPVTANNASVVSTIVVPAAIATQNARRADYISASSLGLKVTVTDIPPTGKTASFSPITSSFALTTGVNLIVIPTPASASGHTEDLTYVTYNAAPAAGAIPASAKALGWALSTGLVIAPGQNTNSVALAGVVDGFGLVAASGSFGMMSSSPPTLAGSATTAMLGPTVTGSPAFSDAGGNSIEGAGGTWPIVGAVPATATSAATGVPVSIVETAGTCGAIGASPHLMLSYNGGTPTLTAALSNATDTVAGVYDGNGGAGWSAIVSVKGQTQTLTYTFASLAVTSTSTDFSCASQTLSFSQLNESALFSIAETTAAKPYTLTVPATTNCMQSINVYQGNSVLPAAQIPYGTATSLGANTTFTIQLVPSPPGPNSCTVQLQDAGGTSTYVSAVLPSSVYKIIVP